MNLGKEGADLHIHTTVSDGKSTVEERIKQAFNRNLYKIAITDHDCISSFFDSQKKEKGEVEIITGAEIKAEIFDKKIEILGYYLDPSNPSLDSLLKKVREYRHERNKKIVEKFIKNFDIDISYKEIKRKSKGIVGRPHLASILVSNNIVNSKSEAFNKYLGKGESLYIPMQKIEYSTVIDVIHNSNGVASLAHPGRIRSDNINLMIDKLKESGLDAMEVWYPYEEVKNHCDINVKKANQIAKRKGLIRTGGSDCHGPSSGKFRIGSVRTPECEIVKMEKAANI